MTGCTCYSNHGSCKGSYIYEDICYAQNVQDGLGVYAIAQCVVMPGELESGISQWADDWTTTDDNA